MPANRLYDTWFAWARKLLPGERVTRVRNLAWFIVGMYLSQSVHLSRIAAKLPFQVTLCASTQRLDRFLRNKAFRVHVWYRPMAAALLQAVSAQGPVRLIVDGSKVSAQHQLLIVTLAYRKRALPIAWTWVPRRRGHSCANVQLALLRHVHALLPHQTHVLLIGDSEFGAVAVLQQACAWHWHYVLRQRGNLLVCVATTGGFQHLKELVLHKGKVFWHPHTILTEQMCHTSLLTYWRRGEKEPWLLSTNLPDAQAVLHAYRLRMWIEEMFGDWKKHGVDLERTHLGHVQRLSRLTFVVALWYLWLVTTGSQVIQAGLRRLVDRKDRRDLSIYRIGLYFIARCCACDLLLIVRLVPYFHKL